MKQKECPVFHGLVVPILIAFITGSADDRFEIKLVRQTDQDKYHQNEKARMFPSGVLTSYLFQEAFFLGCRSVCSLNVSQCLFRAFLALQEVSDIVTQSGVKQTLIWQHRIGNSA